MTQNISPAMREAMAEHLKWLEAQQRTNAFQISHYETLVRDLQAHFADQEAQDNFVVLNQQSWTVAICDLEILVETFKHEIESRNAELAKSAAQFRGYLGGEKHETC